jgi:hypothetical protein
MPPKWTYNAHMTSGTWWSSGDPGGVTCVRTCPTLPLLARHTIPALCAQGPAGCERESGRAPVLADPRY